MSDYPTVTVKNKTLGVELLVKVPADLEAMILASNKDDVYNAALKHSFYQGYNSRHRKSLCEHLEKLTGVARRQDVKGGQPQVRTKKDGSTTPILESEKSYINFLLSEGHISEADYAIEAQKVADSVEFKVSKAEEEAEPDKEYFVMARKLLAAVEAGAVSPTTGAPVTEDSIVAKFNQDNPGHDFEALGGFTELGLARALEINANRIKRESAEALLG